MKIKDYKCKCGNDDFFFADEESQTGIYCSYCGKWFKWANKDEKNLVMNCTAKTGKWVQEVNEMYQKAIDLPYIKKPLAWALYQVWKKHDKEDKSRRTDNER